MLWISLDETINDMAVITRRQENSEHDYCGGTLYSGFLYVVI
jgi:hypothetical protein